MKRRNGGGEHELDRNNGNQICINQIKSRNEGVMTSEHVSYVCMWHVFFMNCIKIPVYAYPSPYASVES